MRNDLFGKIQSFRSQLPGGLSLNIGNPYLLSNKEYQNQLLGKNLFRKAVQLVRDIEYFNKKASLIANDGTAVNPSGRGSVLDKKF